MRIMLHGPWLELKFPKRNLPLRRMYDDKEPDEVVFLDQKEVIDLTNCAIDLIPENLPSKRCVGFFTVTRPPDLMRR